jgi:hypothetical protein
MPQLLLACQIGLSLVFLLAANGKLLNTHDFMQAIRVLRLTLGFEYALAVVLIAVEICLSLALLLSSRLWLPFTMVVSVVALLTFTAWMIFVYAKGLQVTCGCFGTGESVVGYRSIFRNLILIGVGLLGFALSLSVVSPLPSLSLWLVITVTSMALIVMLVQAFYNVRPKLLLSQGDLRRAALEAERNKAIG